MEALAGCVELEVGLKVYGHSKQKEQCQQRDGERKQQS